jgi:Rod binding domain-containing protein
MNLQTAQLSPTASANTELVRTQFARTPFRVTAPESQHDKLVKQAGKWVAMSFFSPMLKQMRESPFHSDLFDGGRGGEAFGAMYDQELVQHMSGAVGKKLVNSMVRRMEANKAYKLQKATNLDVPKIDPTSITRELSHVAATL